MGRKTGKKLGLLLESLLNAQAAGKIGANFLDSDVLLKPGVQSLIDGSHCAASDFRNQLVLVYSLHTAQLCHLSGRPQVKSPVQAAQRRLLRTTYESSERKAITCGLRDSNLQAHGPAEQFA